MGLKFTQEAAKVLRELQSPNWKVKLKKINEPPAQLEANPRHSGLDSHKYQSLKAPYGGDVRESYVENQTPGGGRIFWQFGPDEGIVTIVTIGPHLD